MTTVGVKGLQNRVRDADIAGEKADELVWKLELCVNRVDPYRAVRPQSRRCCDRRFFYLREFGTGDSIGECISMGKSTSLFGWNQIRNQRSKRLEDARDETEDTSPEVIMGMSKEEYAETMINEYGFEPVSVDYDNASVEPWSSPRERKYMFLPAAGNLELLRFDPYPRERGTNTYSAEIVDDGYCIRLDTPSQGRLSGSEKVNVQVKETIDGVREQQGQVEEVVEKFHEKLRKLTRNRYDTRKTEIERQQAIQDDIDFPVRKQEDVPELLDIEPPEERDVVDIKQFEDQSDPAWRIPKDAYLNILDMLNDLGDAFERRPDLFEGYGEEDIRDLMLFFLEEHFVGSASGETFNKQGKTDMMLQTDDVPVFVAECAIWNGPKTVTEKIDQLIENYLTWRDSKSAVILFVDRADMSGVLEKISETVEDHPQFQSAEDQKDHSWWQYRFELPDSGKEIDLGVQAYYIPTLR